MTKVGDLFLTRRYGYRPILDADTAVSYVLKAMSDSNCPSAIITSNGRIAGIFARSDRSRIADSEISSVEKKVGLVMTKRVWFATPDSLLLECFHLMRRIDVRALPVIDKMRILGVVEISEIGAALVASLQWDLEQMHLYISGGYMAPTTN